MSLRPVDSQEDHLPLLHNSSVHRAEGDPRHPNRQCSRHDIPPVVLTSLPAEGGTISPQGSRPAGPKCSPLGGSDDPPIIEERPLLLGGQRSLRRAPHLPPPAARGEDDFTLVCYPSESF